MQEYKIIIYAKKFDEYYRYSFVQKADDAGEAIQKILSEEYISYSIESISVEQI